MPTLRRLKVEHPEIAQLQYQYARTHQARNMLTSSQAVVRINPAIIKLATFDAPKPSSEIEVYIPRAGDVERLYSLTPRYLSRSARDDNVNNTFLELSERRIDRAGVPACIKAMVTAHNRDNPLKTYGDIRAPLPLDAPAYLDGTMSRVETVSEASGRELSGPPVHAGGTSTPGALIHNRISRSREHWGWNASSAMAALKRQ